MRFFETWSLSCFTIKAWILKWNFFYLKIRKLFFNVHLCSILNAHEGLDYLDNSLVKTLSTDVIRDKILHYLGIDVQPFNDIPTFKRTNQLQCLIKHLIRTDLVNIVWLWNHVFEQLRVANYFRHRRIDFSRNIIDSLLKLFVFFRPLHLDFLDKFSDFSCIRKRVKVSQGPVQASRILPVNARILISLLFATENLCRINYKFLNFTL